MTSTNLTAPELLSPAGSLKHLHYAFAYGADAIYAGQPRYSLRARNNEFKHDQLIEGIGEARRQNKKFYVASNLSPHNDKLRSYIRDMEPIIEMKPDALIMADPGLIMMVREKWPDMPVHLSVQANAVNWATVKFWHQFGVSRVILSRELSIEEIQEIAERCPEVELEVFVHGALCIAYSGRCLLSGYMNHRDSNQGACTNACRWKYDAHEAKETLEGNVVTEKPLVYQPTQEEAEPAHEKIFLLQEQNRPGEYMPAYEDENGTYIMNSKDLRAVQHVETLTKMGVKSLKIEGRTKSHYYAARTAQIYRQAIDDAVAGRGFNMSLMDQLEKLSNRGYTEGFYRRHPPKEFQNYETGISRSDQQMFVGEIRDYSAEKNMITIDVKNRFQVGDVLELMTPQGNHFFKLDYLQSERGEQRQDAPGSGHVVQIPLPFEMPMSSEYGLLMKSV